MTFILLIKKEALLPVSCECLDHSGKELINQTLNLNAEYVFECLFSRNHFNIQFAKLRKISRNKKNSFFFCILI